MNSISVLPAGECHNASPAGKRRITSEQEARANADELEAQGLVMNHRLPYSPFVTITALAIVACVAVVVLFTLVFVVLQVSIYFGHLFLL